MYDWPIWDALDAIGGEWAETLSLRLTNAGDMSPETPEWDRG
jgi:hypothetical protein